MIAIIDYNAGNNQSVANALDRLQAPYSITADPAEITAASHVILPGVGHAASAMSELRKRKLASLIPTLQQPVLGICLGMQLYYNSTQEGDTRCLGILPGEVKAIPGQGLAVPHMGWNDVNYDTSSPLFEGIASGTCFYLVHSYYADIGPGTMATCQYGLPITVAVQHRNFYGVQFHPEKSSLQGQSLLQNFINITT